MDRAGSWFSLAVEVVKDVFELMACAEGADLDGRDAPAGGLFYIIHGIPLQVKHGDEEAILRTEGGKHGLDEIAGGGAGGGVWVIRIGGHGIEHGSLVHGEV